MRKRELDLALGIVFSLGICNVLRMFTLIALNYLLVVAF